MSFAAIILAAGLGTRMGSCKALLDIAGMPALARVLAIVDQAGLSPSLVVLGRDADLVKERVDLSGRSVVVNSEPEQGLASSLAAGLAAIPATSLGSLVFHTDMPFVRASTVSAVRALAEAGAYLAAPRYNGVRGFPVFLSRRCLDSLVPQLHGDAGARDFIERHRASLRVVDVDDPGCIRDVDCPEDLLAYAEENSWTTCG